MRLGRTTGTKPIIAMGQAPGKSRPHQAGKQIKLSHGMFHSQEARAHSSAGGIELSSPMPKNWKSFTETDGRENKLGTGKDRARQKMRRSQKIRTDRPR